MHARLNRINGTTIEPQEQSSPTRPVDD
jgi:hypothetical protein